MKARKVLLTTVLALVFIGGLPVLGASDLPFVETFEALNLDTLNGQSNWLAAPTVNAQVQNTIVYGGEKAASLGGVVASCSFTGATATSVWFDCHAYAARSKLSIPRSSLSSRTSAAFYINTNGYVVALSDSTWVTNADYIVPAGTWSRFTVNLNYVSSNWSIYVSGATPNSLATNLLKDLAFQSSATNTSIGILRITAGSNTVSHVDNITVADGAEAASDMPLCIDNDEDGMPDKWENTHFGNLDKTKSSKSDADDWSDWEEYIAGTDPNGADSYMRIHACDLTNAASSDITITVTGGAHNVSSVYAADEVKRTYSFFAANDYITSTKEYAGSVPDGLTGINKWTDANAVNLHNSKFYYVAAMLGEASYTNTAEDWAMYVQDRPANSKFLTTVPIDFESPTSSNNLNSAMGEQLARGLYANSDIGKADTMYYRSSGEATYECFYLVPDGEGGSYWWQDDPAGPANVPVTAGMAFWVKRGADTASRPNAVYAGKCFTPTTVTSLSFKTSYGGWTMFGWPLPRQRWHLSDGGANQLGFGTAGAMGGKTVDPLRPSEIGDQIWVWEDNTWKHWYWLCGHFGSEEWDGKWRDAFEGGFANFVFEPGKAYYYHHPTNQWGPTDFTWTPEVP